MTLRYRTGVPPHLRLLPRPPPPPDRLPGIVLAGVLAPCFGWTAVCLAGRALGHDPLAGLPDLVWWLLAVVPSGLGAAFAVAVGLTPPEDARPDPPGHRR